MKQFIKIITDNYKKVIYTHHIIKEDKLIKNVLFFKELANTDNFKSLRSLINIIIKPESFEKIKQIIITELKPEDQTVLNKINSFGSIPKQITIPQTKYGTEYNTKESSILTHNNLTSLNTSILKMLEYFNSCTFMSSDVFSKLDKSYCNIKTYKPINTNIENVYLLDNNKQTNINPLKLPFLSKITTIVIESLNDFFNIKTTTKIDLVLYAVNVNKLFPNKRYNILDENNANSGDTIPQELDLYRPMIRLYRSEELIKVLIHEVIHCTGFERRFGEIKTHNFKVFNTKYNNSELLFNETITETLAEIINCILYSIIHNEHLDSVLSKEFAFGIQQSAKILDHYGFTSIDDFLNKKNNKKINQSTAVFEYHILKTVLFYKFEQFIDILKTGKAIDMMNLIITTMNEPLYGHYIDSELININTNKSFRMTTIEIYTLDTIPINNMIGGTKYMIEYNKYKQKYLKIKSI